MTYDGLIIPLPHPIRDRWNAEHDMVQGPCACGATHHSPDDYLHKVDVFHVHLVNPPCDGPDCSYCVARKASDQRKPSHD